MSSIDFTLRTIAPYDAWRWAERLFEERDHYGAAEVLEHLVKTSTGPDAHDLAQVRELLMRAYFHGARLEKAIDTARDLLEREPDHGYAALLLSRALERAGRKDEAVAARGRAKALGLG